MFSKELSMSIGTINKVKKFVDCNWNFDGVVDVISGRYIIDGKSIMGMFSLDLTHEIQVKLSSESESNIEKLLETYRNAELM